MERNVPKLRFKGFNDEWKIDKLNENTYIKGRIGWKNLKQEEYTLKGPYLIAGKHINEGIINWDKCDHISEERYEESMEIALKDDDIIFSKDGSIGNPALIQNLKVKATINGTMMLIRLDQNEYEPSYFYQILKSEYFEKLIRNVKSGSSIPHIFQRDMIEFKFPVPGTLQEQKRIANFLTKVDKIIEKQDEKVKNLEKYKKGMMQKIFSQEIRFKDENGEEYPEWKEYKLKDIIAEARLGGNYENSEKESNYPLIKMGNLGRGNINIDKIEYIPENIDKNIEDVLKYGDLLFNTRNTMDLVGKVSIWRNELKLAYYNSNLLRLKFKKELVKNNFFMNYSFNTEENLSKLKSIATGTTSVAAIYTKDLNNVKFSLPSLQEQEKIVNLLVNIDTVIEKEKSKLEELKRWKKGLLQQMFV